MASKYSEAVRKLREAELKCPNCASENVGGAGGDHIRLDGFGSAICLVCFHEWRVKESA
jgi:hypothetical protein